MPEKFDVVVAGAGPAGTTVALILARAGLAVALIERGEYPGSKNMFGGVLYGSALEAIIPQFWQQAPVGRPITRRIITALTSDASISLDYYYQGWKEKHNGFTVSRGRFDKWYAGQARAAGAMLITSTRVVDLLWKGSQVIGVTTDRPNGDLLADVVVAADGVNSILAEKAGLKSPLEAGQVSVGIKEVLELSPSEIEERFHLAPGEGVSQEFVGWCTAGLPGGGFLYTNGNSLALGLVVNAAALRDSSYSLMDLLDKFKQHPALVPILRGAVVREYAAHLIPEGGLEMVPQLVADGMLVVGDAAGFVLANGLHLEGMNYAVASGQAAAEAILEVHEKSDFSKASLAGYQRRLEERFVLQDLRRFRYAPHWMSHSHLYRAYPNLFAELFRRLFEVNTLPKEAALQIIKQMVTEHVGLRQLILDFWHGRRVL